MTATAPNADSYMKILGAILLLLLQSVTACADDKQPIKFDPRNIEIGTTIIFPVNDLTMMVVHRTASDVLNLQNKYTSQKNPNDSCQECNPIFRSIKKEYFVTWGYHPDSGCGLIYVSSEADEWVGHTIRGVGGFVDKCSGSEYDLSGRKIFGPDSSASVLPIPQYDFQNENLVIHAGNAE